MTGRPSRRGLVTTLLAVLTWAAAWAVTDRLGWNPRPVALLGVAALLVATAHLLSAVGLTAPPVPRARLRVAPGSPVGEDPRLLRHQLRLEDAVSEPPSCRPVLTRIGELARERVRLVHGTHDETRHLGDHLTPVLRDPPPDRTRLSPRELTRLVDDLEQL